MNASLNRASTGGLIDRSKPVRFKWEGAELTGFSGDSLASALLANGIKTAGRSFKYHRPRGIIAAGVEESNVLVQLGEGARSTPNVRATEVRLYDGLVARPVNCWPNSRFDVSGINNIVSRFLPAGFYYKTFMWPNWHLYEGIIRKAAGLGKVAKEPDPDRYESRFSHCDVLVVGGGPAGIAAAVSAARSGARVILVEQDCELGGALLHDEATIDGIDATEWVRKAKQELAACTDVSVRLNTCVVGYHDHNSLTMVEQLGNEVECAADPGKARYRTWLVRAGQVILATGSIERPLVFPGNDRPGIMLAAASRHYARRYAVLPGMRSVIFTNNDDAYKTVAALVKTGGSVVAVVDVRDRVSADLVGLLARHGVRHIKGGAIVDTKGFRRLKAVQIQSAGRDQWLSCDHVAMSGGYNPTVHLHSQSGGGLRFDSAIQAFVPDGSAQRQESVGAALGEFSLGDALRRGHDAGYAAAARAGFERVSDFPSVSDRERREAALQPCWLVAGSGRSKAFVDFQNDVSADDIALSARENFRSVEHLKRYTTLGMAADQGKTSNVNALAIMGALTGRSVEETGYTRYRFPYVPIPLGALASRNRGELYRPLRRMPIHRWHEDAGAQFEDFGGWARPAYYLRAGESRKQAEQREARAVRNAAGLFDGSPLGKIEVKGRDAARFLDLIYANTMSTLKQGKVRYGLMLSETGVVIDDGVATRLSDDHFLVGTSSGGADRIVAWMEEWLQCEWLDFDVVVAPVTTAWGVVTLTGPKAKGILRAAGTSIDLDQFPHMSFAEGTVGGVPARVFRVSYTGETSYEINVAARSTLGLWQLLVEKGAGSGVTPIGIDAWDLLRTEKGYLHIGADTDGTTTALDVGWDHILKKKNDFVGKRSLLRQDDQREDRLNLVGLEVDATAPPVPIGAHIISHRGDGNVLTEGYVTSSAFSPALDRGVALAMLRSGRRRKGEVVTLKQGDQAFRATVVEPTFYDPAGERLRG